MADDQVQEIKDRIDIVDLVNQYVPLKRSGLNHKGLCPFHKEKSPSFMVNAERQIYKCFGCDEGGDVISFVQKMEGLTFPEALELLADRVGIKLDRKKAPAQYQQEKDVKSRLFRINAASAKFFHHLLLNHPSGKSALDYLHGRKVTDESIKIFQIGYAPSQPVLMSWLGKQGFAGIDLSNAGSPERFKNRIMFPIRDTLGNVVGFTGRSMPGDPTLPDGSDGASVSGPKYYNTPETPIFKKSKLVYGLFEGKQAIRTEKQAVLVEGQMDVVLSHQAGVQTAVASSGTAITLDHLKAVKRYTSNVLIAFDADTAGQAAAKKTITLTFEAELGAKIVRMPEGFKDAGEIIEKDPSQWAPTLKKAVPAMDWLIEHEIGQSAEGTLDGPAKKAVAKAVLPMLLKVGDPVEQAHYVGLLASRLRVPEQSLLDALKRAVAPRGSAQSTTSAPAPPNPHQARSLDEQLAGLLALHPSVLDKVVVGEQHFAADSFATNLYKAVKSWYTGPDRPTTDSSLVAIKALLEPDDQAQFDSLILEVQELLAEHEPADIALELATRLTRDTHESLKASIAERIRIAESAGDRATVKKLMIELQTALKP